MVKILIHNLQNRKSCHVIVRYFADIHVFDDLAKLYMLMITREMQRENTRNATRDYVKKSL